MRNLKRVLALAMAMVMILGMMVIGSSAASYTDEAAINEDYAVAVEVLSDMGVFQGTGAGFAPKATLDRASAAALIYRVITADVKDSKVDLYDYASFADVEEGAWYTPYVTYAANGGYILGYDGNFMPNDKVTGIQVLAIMLRAMGYGQKGEFEGAGWKDGVLTVADELGILDNVAEDDLDKAASRELVAQLLFDAIQAPTTTYTPAFGYYPTTNASLGVAKFGLAKTAVTDDWGRPAVKYTFKTGTKATTIAVAPVASYTTSVNECQVATDMKIAKVATVPVYTNGVKADYIVNATDIVTRLGAQGTLTEVYTDRIVIIDTYLAQVQTVVPQLADAAGHVWQEAANGLYVYDYTTGTSTTKVAPNVTANYTIEGNNYAKGEMILISINDADPTVYIENGIASALEGTQTRLHFNLGKHTVNGVDYPDAAHLQLNEAGTELTKHTWYFDQYGNLIGVVDVATQYTYGVIKNIWWSGDAATGTGKTLATIVDMTGAESVVTVGSVAVDGAATVYTPVYSILNTDVMNTWTVGTGAAAKNYIGIATNVATNAALDTAYDLIDGHLLRIETLVNGSVALTEVTGVTAAVESGDAYIYTTGTPKLVVNDNTQFLIRTATPAGMKFAAITGYRNIGNYDSAEIDFVDKNRDGIADYVYIIGAASDAVTSNLFYLTSTTYTYELLANKTAVDYYVLNGYVDGQPGSIKVKGVNANVVASMIAEGANSMFVVTTENGYVKAIQDTVDGSSFNMNNAAPANRAYTNMYVVELTGAAGDVVNAGVFKDGNVYYNMAVNTPVVGEWTADMSGKVITLVWKYNSSDDSSRDVVAAYIVNKAAKPVIHPTVPGIPVATKAAYVNNNAQVIYVDQSLNAAAQTAAVKAALLGAGYADANVDVANGVATVVTNGLTKTFNFFDYTADTTGSKAQYCANDGIDVYFDFASDAIASGELTAVLYSGKTALAEATFVPEAGKNYEINDGFDGVRTTCFYVNMTHDSGSWNGNNFVPTTTLKPTSVGVYLNGVLYQTIDFTIADADWASLIALNGVHVGCSDTTCK